MEKSLLGKNFTFGLILFNLSANIDLVHDYKNFDEDVNEILDFFNNDDLNLKEVQENEKVLILDQCVIDPSTNKLLDKNGNIVGNDTLEEVLTEQTFDEKMWDYFRFYYSMSQENPDSDKNMLL